MTTITEEQTSTSPGAAFTHVMTSAVEFAAAKVSQKAGGWTDRLNDVAAGGVKDASDAGGALATEGLDAAAEGGGAKQQASAKGVRAGLQGKNPVWAAIKGAWSGGSSTVRAAIVAAVVALVLLLVLSPVLLLVFLLALLIIAAATKARSAKQ
jgi:hypothetical protein